MTNLTKQEVKHIAKLAKLDISEKEVEKFKRQLSNVINYVGELNEVDTKNTEPTSQTTGLLDIKREDVIDQKDFLNVDEALSGTDKTHNGYFKVSAILEE